MRSRVLKVWYYWRVRRDEEWVTDAGARSGTPEYELFWVLLVVLGGGGGNRRSFGASSCREHPADYRGD